MSHKTDRDVISPMSEERGYEKVAAELAELDADQARYRKEYEKWAARAELARKDPNIPKDLGQRAAKFAAQKLAVLEAGERYRAYLVVELDQLRIRERKPYDVN